MAFTKMLVFTLVAAGLLWTSESGASMSDTTTLRVDATFSALDAINTEVEVPSSVSDEETALTFNILFLNGLDLFGLMTLAARANEDPFLAFRYELTNLTDANQFFFLRLAVDTVDTGAVVASDVFMDWRVIDTDGSGAASVIDGQAAANLGTDLGVFQPFAMPLSPPAEFGAFNVTSSDPLTVMDQIGATPDPADFFDSNFFTVLEMQALGFLSLGDTVVIQGFACIADTTQTCPDRPDLDALFAASSVPIPTALWLFGSGLVSLVGIARRKKAA